MEKLTFFDDDGDVPKRGNGIFFNAEDVATRLKTLQQVYHVDANRLDRITAFHAHHGGKLHTPDPPTGIGEIVTFQFEKADRPSCTSASAPQAVILAIASSNAVDQTSHPLPS
ncbi:MAG: hypothetical protein ACKVLA_19470 [Rhodobacterales bacterium]